MVFNIGSNQIKNYLLFIIILINILLEGENSSYAEDFIWFWPAHRPFVNIWLAHSPQKVIANSTQLLHTLVITHSYTVGFILTVLLVFLDIVDS